ncbi:hypothetical protein N7466_002889 [Penicillium verhagenii]|uniref:uncharacterized protein n=1 Tax=Penicillium verhagenii TaxID=1562060 RepID=UPI0025455C38|nr:uncharacterized protein N7466_002889 [Penicillium verhagenii]KAJ5939755.1 hypothetical protein N7466_002889 [Penicillium verhagenii]
MALTRPPARIRKSIRRMERSLQKAKNECRADKVMSLMSAEIYIGKKQELDKMKRATLEMGFYLQKPKETQEKATMEKNQPIEDEPMAEDDVMTEEDSMMEEDSGEDSSTAHDSNTEKHVKSDENKKEGEHVMGAMDEEANSSSEDSSEEFCTDMETDTESESSEPEDYEDEAMETVEHPEEDSISPQVEDPYYNWYKAMTARSAWTDNEGTYADTEKDNNKNDGDNEIKTEPGTQTENELVNDSPNSEEMEEEITEGQASPEPKAQPTNTNPGPMTVRMTGMSCRPLHDSDTDIESVDSDPSPQGDELPATEEAKSKSLVLKLPLQARQVRMRPESTTTSYCSSSSDHDQFSDDSSAELLIRVASDNVNSPPTRHYFRKQVAWQIERHIQWTGQNAPWKNARQLCRTLDVKTAASLRRGIYGPGNMRLNKEYCVHDSKLHDWGRPAHCLRTGVELSGKPISWLWHKEARELLISLENFYFGLDEEEKDELPENAFQWWEFRDQYSPLERCFGAEIVELFEQAGKGPGADDEGEE